MSRVNSTRRPAPRPTQFTLPLDCVPEVVRAHGLREAHSHPLVAIRTPTDEIRSFRTTADDAWREINPYQMLEWPRTGTSYAALVLDCDSRESVERAYACAMGAGPLPMPNVTITRLESRHVHAGWMLQRPVLRGSLARPNPLRVFARIAEFYTRALDADRGYVGVLASNPIDTTHYTSSWLRRDGFSLAELARAVPDGWRWRRSTKQPATAPGRNCCLFERLMRFGGSPRVTDAEVEHHAHVLNSGFLFPLDVAEVAGIIKSVNEHYRALWRDQGWHTSEFIERQTELGRRATNQVAAGIASGIARRAAVEDRDQRILTLLAAGESTRKIAADVGLDQSTVVRIQRRRG